MDFNDIQSAWNSDKPENVELPINLEKLKSANMPIDKIRKNLRNELLIQIATMIGVGFLPTLNWFPTVILSPFYLIYSIMFVITIYYLGKLFFFYKRLNKTSLDTKDNLYETYFDIRLNMELYKTFCFAIFPFGVLLAIGVIFYKFPQLSHNFISEIAQNKLPTLFIKIIVSIIIMGIITEFWVEFYYGKYAKQIRKILDELRED